MEKKKGKDPAFLFYSSNFLTGTMLMSYEDKGKYITLLSLIHQQGHLPKEDFLSICGENNKKLLSKFKIDSDGLYYSERLEEEIINRKIHGEKQRENVMKRWNKEDTIVLPSYEIGNTNDIPLSNTIINSNIYKYLESNYNRTISSIEYKEIEEWLSIFTEDIIIYAIKLSILANVKNFKYVNGILRNWKTANYKTLKEIQDNEYNNAKKEDHKKVDQELVDYDWLNESSDVEK